MTRGLFSLRFRSGFALGAILSSMLPLAVSRAEDLWTLTTADFKSRRVAVVSIDNAGAHVTSGSEAQTIPLDQFLQLDRANNRRSSASKLFLCLRGGEKIGGESLGLSGESLRWISPLSGEMSFPVNRVTAIVRTGQPAPQDDSTRPEDIIVLANGDGLHGIINDITQSTITIQPPGAEATSVPVSSIAAAYFASTFATTSAPTAVVRQLPRQFRVSLVDGSAIIASNVSLDAQLHLKLSDDSARDIDRANVIGIEQVNGPVIWLDTIAASINEQKAYLGDQTQPARMNRTVNGFPVRFGGRDYSHGIGVHSYSRVVYPIEPGVRGFRTQFAIDGDLQFADVTVRVRLDDSIAFQKEHVKSGALSPVVSLDIDAQKTLTLEVDYGDNYDVQDRLNWIEPAFLRNRPVAPPTNIPATLPATSPTTQP